MDLTISARSRELCENLQDFLDNHVEPNTPVYMDQIAESGRQYYDDPPIFHELKAMAKGRGLWNLFLSGDEGPGLSNIEYAPICEIMGRNLLLAEVTNCGGADTSNMEILSKFGTPEQKRTWLEPLMDGSIRSSFAMTEPWVASSDATNMASAIERDGDEFVVNAHKWYTSGAATERCKVAIVMGVSDDSADRHRRHSMILVPMDTPGVRVVRGMPVFGHNTGFLGGHCEVVFENVRVPATNILGDPGGGFAIAQARLGPGRIHHCMRVIGMTERALELMCIRAQQRRTWNTVLADQGIWQERIAEARIAIEQARLLVMKTAYLMDTVGNKEARLEIAAIKVVCARMATQVIDHAIQIFGAAGLSDDFPLASMYAFCRSLHIVDGPDEVHRQQIARQELKRYEMFKGSEQNISGLKDFPRSAFPW